MPRNRREIDRVEKVDEIVRVGARILRRSGYLGLSVQAVASELGIARGAVYWYFATKDELFAASAARAIADALRNPPHTRSPIAEIVWGVEQLATLQPVHTAMQERARSSPAVSTLLAEIQQALHERLRQILEPHVNGRRLDAVARVIFIFVQGTLSMPLEAHDRQRHLRFLLRELLAASR